MKNWLTVAALLTALLGGACSPAPDQVVFALKPDKDPDKMLEEQNALEEFLSERLGKPVSVIIPLSGSVILEGFANGTIDVGYISATEMTHARDSESASLLLAGEIDGKTSYTSYWVSLKDKPYTSVKDLQDKPVAFSSHSSTSGFVIPFWDLHKKDLLTEGEKPEAFFGEGNVWYGVGYVSAIERVLTGDSEAAAVSYYVLDEDRHLTPEQKEKLKKVTEQGPVPTHVIAASSRLSDEDRASIKSALLEFNDDDHSELRDKLFTSKLVEVEAEEHLESITEAIGLARNVTR